MIERLKGQCVLKHATGIVLDVAGVGYGVEMTQTALARVVESDESLTIWVHTHVREDALRLFGFLTKEERMLFGLLLSISEVGPKVALAIVGGIELGLLVDAMERDDAELLRAIPGVGPSKSKKITLELKPKLLKLVEAGVLRSGRTPQAAVAWPVQATLAPDLRLLFVDLKSALENFGYKDKELAPLLRRFEQQLPSRDLAELIRLALGELTGARRSAPASGKGTPESSRTDDEDLF